MNENAGDQEQEKMATCCEMFFFCVPEDFNEVKCGYVFIDGRGLHLIILGSSFENSSSI